MLETAFAGSRSGYVFEGDKRFDLVVSWLEANGIRAFLLKYRVQGVFDYIMHTRYIYRGHRHPDALNDAADMFDYLRSSSNFDLK